MRDKVYIVLALALAVPWIAVLVLGIEPPAPLVALLAGLTIVGAAFLLSWAAEVAQIEISQALAVVLLSLIAILPEYAVDMYFAWQAAQDPTYAQYAVANMTGANRLLIGLGWSLIVILFWWRSRETTLRLHKGEGLEIGTLTLATIYAFTLPLKGSISLFDAVVLIALFALYAWSSASHPPEEPDLVGPAMMIGNLPRTQRRLATVGLFLFAAFAIIISAESFAEGLVETGTIFNIDEFLLVQWLAPLASETPEFIVVILFVLHNKPVLGLRAMLSSKVNQWTLLIGTLPIVFSVSLGQIGSLMLDQRQVEEVFITAAQSLFAVTLLANLTFSLTGAALLLGLFIVQFVFPETRMLIGVGYVVMAIALLVASASRRRGFFTTPRHLIEPFFGKPKD